MTSRSVAFREWVREFCKSRGYPDGLDPDVKERFRIGFRAGYRAALRAQRDVLLELERELAGVAKVAPPPIAPWADTNLQVRVWHSHRVEQRQAAYWLDRLRRLRRRYEGDG